MNTITGKHLVRGGKRFVPFSGESREFKQSTTAGATTAAVAEKVWGEYVPVRSLNFKFSETKYN